MPRRSLQPQGPCLTQQQELETKSGAPSISPTVSLKSAAKQMQSMDTPQDMLYSHATSRYRKAMRLTSPKPQNKITRCQQAVCEQAVRHISE
ncbi:unnamed protein product [Prunus armeniaca]|uniref:Uncharacterized protein n=1 Tax=Prunus armeniaca TaxID=36596 RepID=A0A6J5VIV0_PRUAR|nr:unnamed protein product [Prunus armeniaca]